MRTRKQWLQQLPDGYRERALSQLNEWTRFDGVKYSGNDLVSSIVDAIDGFCHWEETEEGGYFWKRVTERYTLGKEMPVLKRVTTRDTLTARLKKLKRIGPDEHENVTFEEGRIRELAYILNYYSFADDRPRCDGNCDGNCEKDCEFIEFY